MHRPVVTAFAKLAGAVERVDDPDALCVQPLQVVGRFFREYSVARTYL